MNKLLYLIPAGAIVFGVWATVHVTGMVINHQMSINHLIN